MDNLMEAEAKLLKYNQTHILNYLKKLKTEQKMALVKQILELDFEQMEKLYKCVLENKEESQFEFAPINCIEKKMIDTKEMLEFKKNGEEIIKNDKYAIITMAGGQGTRLGWNGPKGTYSLNIFNEKKYIFEILAETLKKSKEWYDIFPYWYIMTSEENNDDTVAFFEKNNYFGYEKSRVRFFMQGSLPLLTQEGKMVIDEQNNKIKTASNGNGGIFKALKKANIIEEMKSNGVEWVYICGVDNIMVKPIDPIFIGLTLSRKEKIASKSILKKFPEEKVGAFCKRNGKPSIIEYIELTEKMMTECNSKGKLMYGDANFISHLLSLDSIEKISKENLKYHCAVKNGLYKFEEFIFDGFEFFDDMVVMRVQREEEFAPIKNKEGIDSPETAKEIYERFFIDKKYNIK